MKTTDEVLACQFFGTVIDGVHLCVCDCVCTHARSLFYSLSLSLSLARDLFLSLFLCLSLSLALSLPTSLSLSRFHPRSSPPSHSLPLYHFLSLSCSLAHVFSLALALCRSRSLSLTRALSHACFRSLAHSLSPSRVFRMSPLRGRRPNADLTQTQIWSPRRRKGNRRSSIFLARACSSSFFFSLSLLLSLSLFLASFPCRAHSRFLALFRSRSVFLPPPSFSAVACSLDTYVSQGIF